MKERITLVVVGLTIVSLATVGAFWLPRDAPEAAPANPGGSPFGPAVELPPTTPGAPETPTAKGTAEVGDTLVMTARTGQPYLLRGRDEAPTYVQVDIDAKAAATGTRTPLDVVLVIDRSGSMAGAKMDDAKQAARRFVGRLGPQDTVAIVSYASTANVDLGPINADQRGRDAATRQIDRISYGGATNISSALELARGLMDGRTRDDRVRRVVLLSDGRATSGSTNPRDLGNLATSIRRNSHSLTTMGLGADYDELTMTAMAKQGGGNYHFLADASKLKPAFDKEFTTLLETVARDTKVVFTLPSHVRFEKLHGFDFTQSGNTVTVPLAEFWSGRNASMLLELDVERSVEGARELLKANLEYRDMVKPSHKTHTALLTQVVTGDAAQVEKNLDGEVLFRREEVATADTYDRAMKRFEDGDKETATRMLRERKAQLVKRQRTLAKTDAFKGAKGKKALGLLGLAAESADEDAADIAEAAPRSGRGKVLVKKNRARAYETRRLNSLK